MLSIRTTKEQFKFLYRRSWLRVRVHHIFEINVAQGLKDLNILRQPVQVAKSIKKHVLAFKTLDDTRSQEKWLNP